MSLSQYSFFLLLEFYSIKMKNQNQTSGEAVALVLYLQFYKHLVGLVFFTPSNISLQNKGKESC